MFASAVVYKQRPVKINYYCYDYFIRIFLSRITLFEWVLILVLIFGGAGLLVRNLGLLPGKRRTREMDGADMDDLVEKELRESREALRDIEAEIEKLRKDK